MKRFFTEPLLILYQMLSWCTLLSKSWKMECNIQEIGAGASYFTLGLCLHQKVCFFPSVMCVCVCVSVIKRVGGALLGVLFSYFSFGGYIFFKLLIFLIAKYTTNKVEALLLFQFSPSSVQYYSEFDLYSFCLCVCPLLYMCMFL